MEKINHNSLCETETHKVGMRDNEILKALECCREWKCKECPCYIKETDGCKEIDEQDILDLINRQQAEIERLQIRNKTLTDISVNYDWKFAKAKFEAITEFAERLKNDKELICDDTYIEENLEEYVDNLVKEMTEKGRVE